MSKVILHIDLNAFFAACEVLRDQMCIRDRGKCAFFTH